MYAPSPRIGMFYFLGSYLRYDHQWWAGTAVHVRTTFTIIPACADLSLCRVICWRPKVLQISDVWNLCQRCHSTTPDSFGAFQQLQTLPVPFTNPRLFRCPSTTPDCCFAPARTTMTPPCRRSYAVSVFLIWVLWITPKPKPAAELEKTVHANTHWNPKMHRGG